MSEQFLQYVWFSKLFSAEQQTTDFQRVEIIDVGQKNTDAGPDVFNAKIKIGDTLWAGNVEFHTCADDWQQHRHHNDKAYDSVILHVVLKAGKNAVRTNGTLVPQMVLKYFKKAEKMFEKMNLPFIECVRCHCGLDPQSPENKGLESQTIAGQARNDGFFSRKNDIEKSLELLVNERLEQKSAAIENLLSQTQNDWEEAFYITTARSFGFGTNAAPFEQTARNLPQKIITKHKDNILQIEAMLFGTAGFLENFEQNDDYSKKILTEYQYFKHKFELKNIDKSMWKFLRLRPTNFPTIRIAQFAVLIHNSSKLFSKIIEQKNYKNLLELFACEPSEYWQNHYFFGKVSEQRSKKLSKSSVDIVLINSVIPFLYCYAKKYENEEMKNFAFSLLKKIPSEKNHITLGFENLGIKAQSAFDSQALTQLKNLYCSRKDCYNCSNKFNLQKIS